MVRKSIVGMALVVSLISTNTHAQAGGAAQVAEDPAGSRPAPAESKSASEVGRTPNINAPQPAADNAPAGTGGSASSGSRDRSSETGTPPLARTPETPPDAHIHRVISIFR